MKPGSTIHIAAISLLALLLLLVPVAWSLSVGEAGIAMGCATSRCADDDPACASGNERHEADHAPDDHDGGSSERAPGCRSLCPCCFPQLPPAAPSPPSVVAIPSVVRYPDLAVATIDAVSPAIEHPPC